MQTNDCQTDLPDPRGNLLSRWEDDGGAVASAGESGNLHEHQLTNAELVHLRIRVIALENMMIAILAEGTERQLEVARAMSELITPRPDATQHPLTLQAAKHMTDFIDRAVHFRGKAAPKAKPEPYKTTPIFDENTLPAGLRKEHRTKAGVWGIIRVIQGQVNYRILEPTSQTILDADNPGYVMPDQPHLVEPMGPMQMVVEFYDHDPRRGSP